MRSYTLTSNALGGFDSPYDVRLTELQKTSNPFILFPVLRRLMSVPRFLIAVTDLAFSLKNSFCVEDNVTHCV